MHPITLLTAADGKLLADLDPTFLSDTARMEISFNDIKYKKLFKDENGNQLDIEEWECLEIEDGKVTAIKHNMGETDDNQNERLGGSINFGFLPHSITDIYLQGNEIEGIFYPQRLPPELRGINMYQNKLEGSLDFASFPRKIQNISLGENWLSGSVDLTVLPDDLEYLYLNNNKFLGSVNMLKLPKSLKELSLEGNAFIGEINLTQLQQSLDYLDLSENQLSGIVDFQKSPHTLCHCFLHKNKFATVRFDSLPENIDKFSVDNNNLTELVDFSTLPENIKQLWISGNKIEGSVDVGSWPKSLVCMSMDDCAFKGFFDFLQLSEKFERLCAQKNTLRGKVNTKALATTF